MKPLVYYCRWQGAVLRLRGRDETAVWGHLVFAAGEFEETQEFRFNLQTRQLTLQKETGEEHLQLDEMGIVVTPNA
ncbi:MAG: hypothetical protein H6659_08740 [Ardenticatenaceae bacterium]|nr:hypothetical protein [Ardenticatenaceae bacterium]MCB8988537.1 hypothetical protein [Ardenticatenaceae bacterium]